MDWNRYDYIGKMAWFLLNEFNIESGVADISFMLSGSNTLGTQPKAVNSSYFWQVTGIKKLQMWGEVSTDGGKKKKK